MRVKRSSSAVMFLVAALVSFGMAYGLSKVFMMGFDMFFLDWRQILLNGTPPSSPFTVLKISNLKDTEKNAGFSEERLLAIIDKLAKAQSKMVILAISPGEIATDGPKDFLKKLSRYPNLFLYVDELHRAKNSFGGVQEYKVFPRQISFFLTHDSTVDDVTRRIMLYYDLDRRIPSPDFQGLPKELNISLKSPEDFKGSFNYMDSVHVHLKIWQSSKLPHFSPSNLSEIQRIGTRIKDKIVIVGTMDTYALLSSPSINHRKDIIREPSIKNSYWSDADLIATYLINMFSGEHIGKANSLQNTIWLTFWFLSIFATLLFCDLSWGIPLSFVVTTIFVILNSFVFFFFSMDFDVGRGLLGTLVIQYFGIPILLMRHLRKVDAEKVESEKLREADRVKSRFIVKAAKADLSLKIAARVSHDIRSPLMALQVAQSVIKGKVSEDLESLIRDSVSRIKFIADDILDNYRNGKVASGGTEKNQLKGLVEDLLGTYRQLNPQTEFETHIGPEIYTYIPSYSLQRCLSNLLNNSIEAMEPIGHGRITISADENHDQIEIQVSDNGKGVSDQIVGRLFSERATHGKPTGTGLGLFQIRKELELYGGHIALRPREIGSCFIITLPNSLSRIPLSVSTNILVVESSRDIFGALNKNELSKLKVMCCSSVKDAQQVISQDSRSTWTVFVDLALSEDESGFDLIEALADHLSGRIILCSAFVDNLEVQKMANRYNAILFNKDLLPRVALLKK